MKYPHEIYKPAQCPYTGLPEVEYPFHDKDILITTCDRICMHRKKSNISTVMAGQRLGIKEVADGIWLVSFMSHHLGYIDLEKKHCKPSTTRSARRCYPSLRDNPLPLSPGRTMKNWCRMPDSNQRPLHYE